MKTQSILILVIALLLMAHAGPGAAISDVRIVISPLIPASQAAFMKERFLNAILNELPGGTRMTFVDGWDLRQFARFTVPEMKNSHGRRQLLRGDLIRLLDWFESVEAGHHALQGTALLRLPESLSLIGRDAGLETAVVFVGSALYVNPAEPDFNFRHPDGKPDSTYRYPADGMLGVSHEESVWGVLDVRRRLGGASIHLLYPSESEFPALGYRARVKRFLALYFGLQQGQLGTFQSDPSVLFDNWLLAATAPEQSYEVDASNAAFAMVPFQRHVPLSSPTGETQPPTPDVRDLVMPSRITQILLVDRTGSMRDNMMDVARMVSLLPDNENYGLWTYGDHENENVVEFFAEGKAPEDMARALRGIEFVGGETIPEAMEDALHEMAAVLRERAIATATIRIVGDAPPHAPAECPHAYDAWAEIQKLLKAGHDVRMILCDPDQDTGWIPEGVVIERLK